MKKLLPYILLLSVVSCALYEPKYRHGNNLNISIPEGEIEKTFFLIGDAGYAKEGKTTDALSALNNYLATYAAKADYTIFLGDNIYPAGMPDKDHEDRAISEHRLNVQIDAVKDFEGEIIFIPGNHDWYNQGLEGLKREEKFLETRLEDRKLFLPSKGCPLESIEVSENIQLIIFDSQWYLENWDNHPTINDDCPQLKTRDAALQEIEDEFKKHENKTVLFTVHHPLYTNGVHGGQYAPVKHLYPSQKKIPLPGLATLAVQVRTAGGVSTQDAQNKQYQSMVRRISTIANNYDNIIVASGHEHSLQYIEHNGVKQIVSGAGAKNSYATLSNDGLFAYGGQGFARLDVYKSGSVWVEFFDSKEGKAGLLYRKQLIKAKKKINVDTISNPTMSFKKASIYTEATEDKKKGVWGDHYRDLYYKETNTTVANLDTLYGGLQVLRGGGGHQTESLRLVDKDGKQYNMRKLKKNASQFLQSTVFKNNDFGNALDETIIEEWLEDIYTAAHPYGFLAIPKLSEAINVRHTNPKLFYVPKQKVLGDYNLEHGDALYMIVERPEKHHKNASSFGKPDDIESTADVYERLRRDEKYQINEVDYIRARLFDMLIGDWDRHRDQWRWAEYENSKGEHIFSPIPRDRDQVFSNFDGAIFSGLRGVIEFTKQFQKFGPEIENVKWLNASGALLDRTLVKNATEENWLEQVQEIQKLLTDEAIDNAFNSLPTEIQNEASTLKIKTNLKLRRNNLAAAAKAYYAYLSQLVIVTATDKDDFVTITRMPNGKTKITVQRIKDGDKEDIISERIYDSEITNEIWVYGLDDDDVFEVNGKGNQLVPIRIIGGQNNDIYRINNGKRITFYDYESKPNTIEKKGNARKVFTDRYQVNHYNQHDLYRNTYTVLPAVGFNPDDGVKLGVTSTITNLGFYRNPFTKRHKISAGYFFATQGFTINYEGEFAGVLGNYNLLVAADYNTPNFAENFFGFGNGSINTDDESGVDFDFNRVRISTMRAKLGAKKVGRLGSTIEYTSIIEGIEVERSEGRFIESIFDAENSIFDRQWFIGLNMFYGYESYDNKAQPTRGMKFSFDVGNRWNTNKTDDLFGYIKPHLSFYNALSRNRKWVLKTAAEGTFNIGNDFQFYQSAQAGGDGLLRGYRLQRFSGRSALMCSADIRYSFNQFRTKILPLQIGVLAGADTGRVWTATNNSNTWHSDYGVGFWLNSLDVVNGTFNLFTGEDGPRVSFDLLFNF